MYCEGMEGELDGNRKWGRGGKAGEAVEGNGRWTGGQVRLEQALSRLGWEQESVYVHVGEL